MKDEDKSWRCRDRHEHFWRKTLVMGILNVTPDSFSDGGRYPTISKAVEHAVSMWRNGARIIDVGGESTRPGASPVSADVEISRTAPVIKELARKTDCLISIDTMKAATARAALESGAHIVNDVSAGTHDNKMVEVVREHHAGVVLMHMRGSPRTMQEAPAYNDVTDDVRDYLEKRMNTFISQGVSRDQIALDPGIGFGKTDKHNLTLLRNIGEFSKLGRPVLVGASRKSFLGRLMGLETDDRGAASLGVAAYSIIAGADIIRVHDVKESCHLAGIIDILLSERK